MNKLIVASIVLGSWATLACAQQETAVAGPASACADCTGDDTAAMPAARHLPAAAPAGSHDIAVFTGIPEQHDAGQYGAVRQGPGSRQAPPHRTADHLGGQNAGSASAPFTLGSQYDFEYVARADVADPAHGVAAAKGRELVDANGKLASDSVRYYSTQMDNISTGGSWTVDSPGGNGVANRAWGMTVGADFGMLSLRAAHQNRHVAQTRLNYFADSNMDAKNSILAANLHTRWGTAYAAYAANRGWGNSPLYNPDNPYGAGMAGTSSTDSRDTLVGVAVPMTRSTTFLASMVHKNDRDLANRDANQVAVGASYVVSRKTDFYAALSHTVTTSSAGLLLSGTRAGGSSAVNVGMRHSF